MDWSPGRGSEQIGIRPAIIIQNDVGNQVSATTIVAAITTQRREPYPFQVAVNSSESGLPRDSIIKCEQIQTIDTSRLGRLVGALTARKMYEVDQAIRRSLEL